MRRAGAAMSGAALHACAREALSHPRLSLAPDSPLWSRSCPFCAGCTPRYRDALTGELRLWAWNLLRGHRRHCALNDPDPGLLARDAPETWTDASGRVWWVPRCVGGLPSSRKSAVAAALRAFVVARDCGVCRWCHAPAAMVDHILAASSGGSHHPRNLRVLCPDCNSTKSGLVDVPRLYGQPIRRSA